MEPTTALILTFIGVLVIGAAKYYERKYGSNPEAWDNQKFGLFVIVAGVIMVLEYSHSQSVAFPADDIIDPLLQLMTPIFSLFGAAYATITGGKLVKNAAIPVLQGKSADGSSGFEAGFVVTPTYIEGKSPVAVTLNLYSASPTSEHAGTVEIEVDWMDGQTETVKVMSGEARATHTYTYVKVEGSKYTGRTFFPMFTTKSSDGTKKMFNIEETGRCCEIWVTA